MNKSKSYSVEEILLDTLLSPTFEFYTSKDEGFMSKELSKLSGKTVYITSDEANPSYSSSILLKEYDSKKPRYSLSFGWLPYAEAKLVTKNVLNWINEFATVDFSTLLKVGLSHDRKLQTLTSITNMNIGKMILKINEDYIWKRFPQMKHSPFAVSIKKLVPTNSWLNVSDVLININETFAMPDAEYYGVDISEQTKGSLLFNYIGGKNYATKVNEVFELYEYFAITTYQIINEEEYTKDQLNELRRITKRYRKLQKCYYNAETFMNEYQDIKVSVNLNSNPQIIKSYWTSLRDPLLKLVLETNMNKGRFNLDTDSGFYQLKNVKLTGVKLNNFEIVSSEINGIIENCRLWKVKLNKSRIEKSTLIQSNKVNESYLLNVRADRENKIIKSYIYNTGEIINCKVTESIIRNAGIGKNARIDESTIIIQPKDEQPIPAKGLTHKEVRDYKWLRDINGPHKSMEWGNKYKDPK